MDFWPWPWPCILRKHPFVERTHKSRLPWWLQKILIARYVPLPASPFRRALRLMIWLIIADFSVLPSCFSPFLFGQSRPKRDYLRRLIIIFRNFQRPYPLIHFSNILLKRLNIMQSLDPMLNLFPHPLKSLLHILYLNLLLLGSLRLFLKPVPPFPSNLALVQPRIPPMMSSHQLINKRLIIPTFIFLDIYFKLLHNRLFWTLSLLQYSKFRGSKIIISPHFSPRLLYLRSPLHRNNITLLNPIFLHIFLTNPPLSRILDLLLHLTINNRSKLLNNILIITNNNRSHPPLLLNHKITIFLYNYIYISLLEQSKSTTELIWTPYF
jgi:hypothetical protein